MTPTGFLRKMQNRHESPVSYHLVFDREEPIPLNHLLGQSVRLVWDGGLACTGCGRTLKKPPRDGFCYPCSQTLAQADLCQTRPELCHHARGTCREPSWGTENCFIPHTVYLANASGLKVGITRTRQETTRWMDQGAAQAIPLGLVGSRLDAGKVEVALKAHYADRTDWRAMLKAPPPPLDLLAERERALGFWPEGVPRTPRTEGPFTFEYPVGPPLSKVVSLGFEKSPECAGILQGIKGQYLIFDIGVLNIRKHAGFRVTLHLP